MLNLNSFFKNHFNTKSISDDHLREFAQDHIGRITANNGGGTFTTMLNDTNTAYTAYFGAINNEDLAAAVQQSLTMSTDNLLVSFKQAIHDDEGTIRGKYGQASPTYQEFFPHGKTEYDEANKSNVETLMMRMRSSTSAHSADFTPAFVTKYAGFPTNYATARNLQVAKIGDVGTRKTTTATSRDGLETQLMKNLFFVGFNFPNNVPAAMAFFDQSIVQRRQSADSDGLGRVSGSITDSVTHAALDAVNIHAIDSAANDVSTDGAGHYLTKNLQIGIVSLEFTRAGYATTKIDVNVQDTGDTNLDVQLVAV